MNRYDLLLAPMLENGDLWRLMASIPNYHTSTREKGISERIIALNDLYKLYLPSPMSIEIYYKLYTSASLALEKKSDKALILAQQKENFQMIKNKKASEYSGIIGGCDSFTIIGKSGIGKSSAIQRATRLISNDKIISYNGEFVQIIPILMIQCPFDCSPKGMLLEVLRGVDEVLGTTYNEKALRKGVTTDVLIGMVAQVCINHVALLIIDEIQHINGHKNGSTLINMITQLINSSGISICLVGTEESANFLGQKLQLARRSIGLSYASPKCDEFFVELCTKTFHYQYVKERTEISHNIIDWLYEHSNGLVSLVISLIHDAQELAIYNGREVLDISSLSEAYDKRMGLLQKHIVVGDAPIVAPKPPKKKATPKIRQVEVPKAIVSKEFDEKLIEETIKRAKENKEDVVGCLEQCGIMISEVVV